MRRRLRARWRRLRCLLHPRGCRPDWAFTIACRLDQPVCIRCGGPIRTLAPDEELGVVCVENEAEAW